MQLLCHLFGFFIETVCFYFFSSHLLTTIVCEMIEIMIRRFRAFSSQLTQMRILFFAFSVPFGSCCMVQCIPKDGRNKGKKTENKTLVKTVFVLLAHMVSSSLF